MSAEQISNLFQNFTKIKSHRDLNKEGVGLGLTISKNLAKALGGDIYVESEIGKGSQFVLKIPVTYPSQQTLEEKKYDFNRH
jgi:signal transduction histidine kinase